MIFKQTLAKKMRSNQQPLLGCWLASTNPLIAELMANVGFDWLVIDGEHVPNSLATIAAQLQALAGYSVQPIVRPPFAEPVIIKQYLELGVLTLLCPLVANAEHAESIVKACQYPPVGNRGVGYGLGRSSRWGLDTTYAKRADQEICIIAQIETVTALAELEAIAQVDGIDAILFGPADLSASMGELGQSDGESVRQAISDGIKRVTAVGKPCGVQTGSVASALYYARAGAVLCGVGSDMQTLARAARQIQQDFFA